MNFGGAFTAWRILHSFGHRDRVDRQLLFALHMPATMSIHHEQCNDVHLAECSMQTAFNRRVMSGATTALAAHSNKQRRFGCAEF